MDNNKYTFEIKVNNRSTREYHKQHESDTYIEGRRGSPYTLYFKNKSYKRVLVCFSVDGLSVMDGKPASDKSNGYIVSGYGSIEVPGWTIDNKKVAKFEFRPQGDRNDPTYIEELASEGINVDVKNQGVIGCMVFEEKEQRYSQYTNHYVTKHNIPIVVNAFSVQPQPLSQIQPESLVRGPIYISDPSMNLSYSSMDRVESTGGTLAPSNEGIISFTSSSSLGTGFGEDKSFNTYEVKFDKKDNIDWIAEIYYDTLTNLKKKGIIIEDVKPNAFPGYSNGCYIPKSRR